MEYNVYANIHNDEWSVFVEYNNQLISVTGKEKQTTSSRIELQSLLEILQFLRNWITEPATFIIYINSQYCISCLDRWIPVWIKKGFRISNSANMRPNSDLLVKLHSFNQCMNITLIQHYDHYEKYTSYFNHVK